MEINIDHFVIDANDLPSDAFYAACDKLCGGDVFPEFDVEVYFSGGLDDHNLNDVSIDLALKAGTNEKVCLTMNDRKSLIDMLKEGGDQGD